jgi:ankyrin repeat protein
MKSSSILDFVRHILDGKVVDVRQQLCSEPELATMALDVGATRTQASDYFFSEINHYMYGGDTALHMAAAAFSLPMVKLLVKHGSDCRARNRRGAEPLHYASDGNGSDLQSQAKVIAYLASIGADPNANDKSGVASLHRAVRTRSPAAVRALLDAGADPTQRNKSGSTPLHLAVQTTGASGSGSIEAQRRQKLIIELLLKWGAKLTDQDLNGKTVEQCAKSLWVRELLAESKTG